MYQLTLSEPQLRTVLAALDFYSRAGCGQFGEILNLFRLDPRRQESFDSETETASRQLLSIVKQRLFPLGGDAAYSICSPEVPVEFRRAWDIYQVARHHLASERPLPHPCTVDHDPPMATTDEPFCRIVRVTTG